MYYLFYYLEKWSLNIIIINIYINYKCMNIDLSLFNRYCKYLGTFGWLLEKTFFK